MARKFSVGKKKRERGKLVEDARTTWGLFGPFTQGVTALL